MDQLRILIGKAIKEQPVYMNYYDTKDVVVFFDGL